MKRLSFLVLAFSLILPVGAMASGVSPPSTSSGNATSINGAAVPASGIFLGSNVYSQLTGMTANQVLAALGINSVPSSGNLAGTTLAQVDAHAALTSGSVAAISATPTNGGTGYAQNDTGTITTGNGDATYKVLTVGGTGGSVVQTVALVFSGSGNYSVATGQATNKGGSQPGSGSGLTINVTAVGLTAAQVSNTQVNQYGQAASAVTNYLPSAQAGESFITTIGTAQTSEAFSFAGNSGIKNGSSGDIIYLTGVAGTAGSSHGVQIVSPTIGAEIVCKTAQTGATTWSWFCTNSVGAWAQY